MGECTGWGGSSKSENRKVAPYYGPAPIGKPEKSCHTTSLHQSGQPESRAILETPTIRETGKKRHTTGLCISELWVKDLEEVLDNTFRPPQLSAKVFEAVSARSCSPCLAPRGCARWWGRPKDQQARRRSPQSEHLESRTVRLREGLVCPREACKARRSLGQRS